MLKRIKRLLRVKTKQSAEVEESELEDDQDVPAPGPELPHPAAKIEIQMSDQGIRSSRKAERRKGKGHKQPRSPIYGSGLGIK